MIFVDALGYSVVPFVNNPSAGQLRKTLTDWVGAARLISEDSFVLYYAGHGHVDPSGDYLYTRGFRKDATADGLKSQALVEMILGRKARRASCGWFSIVTMRAAS
jgi:Caspase domain